MSRGHLVVRFRGQIVATVPMSSTVARIVLVAAWLTVGAIAGFAIMLFLGSIDVHLSFAWSFLIGVAIAAILGVELETA